MSNGRTTDQYKVKYLQSYIHFRTGVLINHIQPPQNWDQQALMNHMYHRAKAYMSQIGKEITIKDV